MSDLSRRDAVKLAAVGAAAVAAGGVTSKVAAAAQAPGKASAASSLDKVTASFIAEAGKAAAAAPTPEEAYKRFMAKAGRGLMQVVADALAYAVSGATELTKGKKGAGWERFVKGCVLNIDFGAPIDVISLGVDSVPFDFQKVLVNQLQDGVHPTEEVARLLGGSISVGGTWTF